MITIAEAHVDDVGTEVRLNVTDGGVPVDLTGATELTIRLRKPSGATVDKPAILVGAATDGVINCYTISNRFPRVATRSPGSGTGLTVVTPHGGIRKGCRSSKVQTCYSSIRDHHGLTQRNVRPSTLPTVGRCSATSNGMRT
ncbi:MAG: hypothetical protein P1U77_27320 [Rubripirellula sp.]|nr:hypothetical protein [Rubripirellula sp.]